MKIRNEKVLVTVAADGTGTGKTDRPVNGILRAVHIDYTSTADTTDVTLSRAADGAIPTETLLTVSNSNTDGWYRPRVTIDGPTGSEVNTIYTEYEISGYLSVAVAGGTAAGSVAVTVLYEAD